MRFRSFMNCIDFGRNLYGHRFYFAQRRIFLDHRRIDLRLRKITEFVMSWLYLLSASLVLLIFVYLVFALFFPEKF
jgi:K+-transporting ATPase KdpF subunit